MHEKLIKKCFEDWLKKETKERDDLAEIFLKKTKKKKKYKIPSTSLAYEAFKAGYEAHEKLVKPVLE